MVEIEKVTPDLAASLLEISRQTFFDAFAHLNSAANIEIYAAKAFTLQRFQNELNNPNSHFYFAKLESEIAGYLKLNLNMAQTDLRDSNALEVERIYVLKQYQGNQIGKQLLDFAIKEALDKSLQYIWLGVWEHNTNAIRFYEGKGFKPFSSHEFMLGEDKQTDLLMKLNLK